MEIINHGLQTLSENFPKKLHQNVTMSTTEGDVLYLITGPNMKGFT